MIEVSLVRGLPVKAGVWASAIVKIQIPVDRSARLADTGVGIEIDLFVFDRFPDPLNKNIVAPRAFAVHADGYGIVQQHTGEGCAGKLVFLIGDEDVRPAVFGQSLLNRFDAERRLHRDRQPPGQNPAAKPVDHGSEIDKTAMPSRCSISRNIRLPMKGYSRCSSSMRRMTPKSPGRHRPGYDPAPADVQGLRLARDGQIVRTVDHRFALGNSPALPSAPSKKSFSSVSSPILACSAFKSTGAASPPGAAEPNTPAAPSSN